MPYEFGEFFGLLHQEENERCSTIYSFDFKPYIHTNLEDRGSCIRCGLFWSLLSALLVAVVLYIGDKDG